VDPQTVEVLAGKMPDVALPKSAGKVLVPAFAAVYGRSILLNSGRSARPLTQQLPATWFSGTVA